MGHLILSLEELYGSKICDFKWYGKEDGNTVLTTIIFENGYSFDYIFPNETKVVNFVEFLVDMGRMH